MRITHSRSSRVLASLTFALTCVAPVLGVLPATAASPTVLPDRIAFGDGTFLPRFTDLPDVLVVPAGTTFTLPADSTWDAIEVEGTLRVSRDYDTTCRFTHLTILPGGMLDAGTPGDPVLRSVDLVIRDVPIDTGRDPYQWGNGVVNLGRMYVHGRPMTRTWTALSAEAGAGTTSLSLATSVNWQTGDQLLIPDTRQLYNGQRDAEGARPPVVTIARESPVSIASISGSTVKTSKGLDFAHPAARNPDGTIRFYPYVANATRNIVVRSQNAQGTRGHIATVGDSMMDLRYAAFIGLGRTTPKVLDSTTAAADGSILRVGTNQVGRYTLHWHQATSGTGGAEGLYLDGTDIGKWGLAIHGTDDLRFVDNVFNRFVGAGFVTEDGDEFRHVVERNFAMGSKGNGAQGNLTTVNKMPGAEGAGFWFHSAAQTIRDNVAINNAIGFNFMAMLFPANLTVGRVPVAFTGNQAVANQLHGVELWATTPQFTATKLVAWHNGGTQVAMGTDTTGSMNLVDPVLLASGGVTTGVHTSIGYTVTLGISGGEIRGCSEGVRPVRGRAVVRDTTLQNLLNINLAEGSFLSFHEFDGVKSLALPGRSSRHAVLTEDTRELNIWDYRSNVGYRVILRDWQQEGTNYTLHSPRALADRVIPDGILPENGLTNGTAWAKYGVAIDGGPVPSDAVPMAGTNAYARPFTGSTPDIPLGVPRLVLLRPPPSVSSPNFDIEAELTGRSASPALRLAFDGSATAAAVRNAFTSYSTMGTYTERSVLIKAGDIALPQTAGSHSIRTWREDGSGNPIPGSELTFGYSVGASTPLPPSEVCGDGIDNDGDGMVDENCETTPAPGPAPSPHPAPHPDTSLVSLTTSDDTVELNGSYTLTMSVDSRAVEDVRLDGTRVTNLTCAAKRCTGSRVVTASSTGTKTHTLTGAAGAVSGRATVEVKVTR